MSNNNAVFRLYNKVKAKLSLNTTIEKYDALIKQLENKKIELDNRAKEILSYNELKIAEIQDLNDANKSLILNLIAKEIKPNFFKRMFNNIFKFDGYLLYINKAEELKIFKINNFKTIYNLNSIESYGLKKCIGNFNGKPIFIVKYPYAMSLDIGENTLSYDSPTFYNYVNKVTIQNLTNFGGNFNFTDFLKKNFILIIIGIALILLFTTPQGKEFLANIIPSSKPV